MQKINLLKYCLIILATFQFFSCRKNYYKVELIGTVYNNVSGQPISNVKVYLIGANTDLASSGPVAVDKHTYVYTDDNGHFKFSFNRTDYDQFYLYTIPANPGSYFSYGSGGDLIPVKHHKKYFKDHVTQDIYLKPLGILKLRLIKTQVANEYIELKCNSGCSGMFYQGYFTDKHYIFNNILGSEFFNLNLNVVKYDTTNWTIKSNINESHDIFINSMDTTYYTLNY